MKPLLSEDSIIFDPPGLGCVLFLSGLPGSSSKIYDRSPYCNVGTITGATWKRLPSGLWYLDFDGSDDCVNCGASSGFNSNNKTVKAWFNADDLTAGARYAVVSKERRGGANDKQGWTIRTISDRIGVYVCDATENEVSIEVSIAIDTWYQAVLVHDYDNSKLYLYLNGTYQGEAAITGFTAYSGSLLIGRHSASGSYYFDGGIALPYIYNRTLSALEIQNSFNQEKHLFGVW